MDIVSLLYGRQERDWQSRANCMGVDPDLFFPERGASTREAKEVCRGCVVREDCLEYALANGEKFGIWGGLSERERRRVRRMRAMSRRGSFRRFLSPRLHLRLLQRRLEASLDRPIGVQVELAAALRWGGLQDRRGDEADQLGSDDLHRVSSREPLDCVVALGWARIASAVGGCTTPASYRRPRGREHERRRREAVSRSRRPPPDPRWRAKGCRRRAGSGRLPRTPQRSDAGSPGLGRGQGPRTRACAPPAIPSRVRRRSRAVPGSEAAQSAKSSRARRAGARSPSTEADPREPRGTKGTTSSAPIFGCTPLCLLMSIRSTVRRATSRAACSVAEPPRVMTVRLMVRVAVDVQYLVAPRRCDGRDHGAVAALTHVDDALEQFEVLFIPRRARH